MGSRSATETVVGIFLAFIEQKTWQQAELAARLGVETRVVRKRLEELVETHKMPLHRDEELKHVYWSVPSNWVPGGVLLAGDEAGQVLRLLARLPQSTDRDRYLRRLIGHVGEEPVANATPLRGNESILRTIEDAASQGIALRFDYYSASRGHRRMRTASVHRLKGGDHWRFVATCHDRNRLCWFRVDNVLSAALAPEESFRATAEGELVDFVSTSLDGFSGDVSPIEVWFVVRLPEARWVRTNLPEEERFETTELGDDLRFQCKTTALDVVARFLVGLGSAVTAASPELAVKATTIARATLDALATTPEQEGSR